MKKRHKAKFSPSEEQTHRYLWVYCLLLEINLQTATKYLLSALTFDLSCCLQARGLLALELFKVSSKLPDTSPQKASYLGALQQTALPGSVLSLTTDLWLSPVYVIKSAFLQV